MGPASRPVANSPDMSKLAQRVRTAVVLVAVLLLILFAAPFPVALAVATLVVALGAWEWSALAGLKSLSGRIGFVVAVLAIIAVLAGSGGASAPLILATGVAWWCMALFIVLAAPGRLPLWFGLAAGVLVLVPAWTAFAVLLAAGEDGPALLLLGLVIVFAADIGAYFTGRRLGHVKLAPRVSPGKTWEGLVGGLACAVAVAGLGGFLLVLPLRVMLPLGAVVAAFSVVGDLTESLFKRGAGLKDSGHILPGHGGVLDRIDGVVAGLPLFALVLHGMERLPA